MPVLACLLRIWKGSFPYIANHWWVQTWIEHACWRPSTGVKSVVAVDFARHYLPKTSLSTRDLEDVLTLPLAMWKYIISSFYHFPFPLPTTRLICGRIQPVRSHNTMSTPVEINNPRCPPRRSNDTSAHGGFREHGECYWMSRNVRFLHEFSLLAEHKLVSSFFSCILLSQFFLTSLNKTCHKSSCNIICFVLSSSMNEKLES